MSSKKAERYQSAAEMKVALSAEGASYEATIINTEEEKHVKFINTEDDGRKPKKRFVYAICVIATVVLVVVCYMLSNPDSSSVGLTDITDTSVMPNPRELETTISTVSNTTSTTTDGKINGHDYVDLGLSVKWATCNVGASSPTDYGNYYAWGETTTKSEYTNDNSRTYNKEIDDIGGDSSYDPACANWGGSWRLPSSTELKELIINCKREWTTQNGVKGRKFTSMKNSKSIFLPAAGRRIGSSMYCAGNNGYYWSSEPDENGTLRAFGLSFNSDGCGTGWGSRDCGHSVRPVSE